MNIYARERVGRRAEIYGVCRRGGVGFRERLFGLEDPRCSGKMFRGTAWFWR